MTKIHTNPPKILNVIILGSTGSLGIQTLEVLKKYRKNFRIIGLSANIQEKLLYKQATTSHITNVVLASRDGEKAVENLTRLKNADIIINVLSGTSGIKPSIAALKANKILILGNKESLFVEGKRIMKMLRKSNKRYRAPSQILLNSQLIPLDSEHNAIFEIIKKIHEKFGQKNIPPPKIKTIYLPCSGGPFYGKTKAELKNITINQALKHPRYKMGKKISIESATLINKGLEIIEAHHLFNLPLSKIKTFYEPKCQIHGAIEFEFPKNAKTSTRLKAIHQIPTPKSTTYAYFSRPDMREHIENALLHAIQTPALHNHNRLNHSVKLLPSNSSEILKPITPGPLSGIKIILKAYKKFKNNPRKLKNFLLHEQKTIQNFLNGKIKFLEIFSRLKSRL